MGLYYCDICGGDAFEETPVYKSCSCGKHVCSYHWDYRNGMCVNCAGTSERSRQYIHRSSYSTANSGYPSYDYSTPDYSYSPSYENNYAETYSGDFPFFKVVGILLAVLFIISAFFVYALMQLVNSVVGLFI